MKNIKKLMTIALLIVLSMGGKALAYTFKITNKTGDNVKIALFWGSWKSLTTKYSEIKNGQTNTFTWKFPSIKAGLCLNGIKIQKKRNSGWQSPEKIRLVRKQVPTWGYPVAGVVTGGIGATVAGFVEAGFECGNQNFDLEVDQKGKVIAVKK